MARPNDKQMKKMVIGGAVALAVAFLGWLVLGDRDSGGDVSFAAESAGSRPAPRPAPASTREPAPVRAKAPRPEAHGEDCGHGHGAYVDPMPASPDMISDRERALGRLRQLLAGWDGDVERPEHLNALADHVVQRLHEGTLGARDVVEFLRHESEPVLIDLLAGALGSFGPSAGDPDVREAMLAMARFDSNATRRQTAVTFLGGLVDESGEANRLLLDLAHREPSIEARLAAISALGERSRHDLASASRLQRGLVEILAASDDDVVRSQAVGALDLYEAAPEVVDAVGSLLEKGSLEARFAAVTALGGAGPSHRNAVLGRLESAYAAERDPGMRAAMVYEIVRAGRTRALEVLRRLPEEDPGLRRDIADYVGILESEEVDLERIAARKARLESDRLGPEVEIHEE